MFVSSNIFCDFIDKVSLLLNQIVVVLGGLFVLFQRIFRFLDPLLLDGDILLLKSLDRELFQEKKELFIESLGLLDFCKEHVDHL